MDTKHRPYTSLNRSFLGIYGVIDGVELPIKPGVAGKLRVRYEAEGQDMLDTEIPWFEERPGGGRTKNEVEVPVLAPKPVYLIEISPQGPGLSSNIPTPDQGFRRLQLRRVAEAESSTPAQLDLFLCASLTVKS
jgi:hypothetical protein